MTHFQPDAGLEAAIQDVICATEIAIGPIEDAIGGASSEAALYAVYLLRDEVTKLHEEVERYYASRGSTIAT